MKIIEDCARKLNCTHSEVFIYYLRDVVKLRNWEAKMSEIIMDYNHRDILPTQYVPTLVDWAIDVITSRVAILPQDLHAQKRAPKTP